MPRVSVLMTVFNAGPHLREAVESVYTQDFTDLELCVVDDGSTDGSVELLRELVAGAPIPVRWEAQANAGQAAALNAAFAMASGEIIALLDGDDYWHRWKIREMVEFMQLNPGGGVYQHQVDDGAGEKLRPMTLSGDLFGRWRELGTVNPLVHRDLFVVNMPTTGLMFSRVVYEAIGTIPKPMVVNPDFYLFVLGCSLGPLYTNPRVLGCWRQHGGNASKRGQYGFKNYWLRVLFPLVNEELRRRGLGVQFKFCKRDLLLAPLALARAAYKRRGGLG
jgi:glycosyltransferase involved in cell wall biosynthesis